MTANRLKKAKWALLKNKESLSDAEKEKLEQIFQCKEFELLKLAYEAKNKFRDIFQSQLTMQDAEIKLEQWGQRRRASKSKTPIPLFEDHQ
ncbi:MAG: hypothetical protein ACI85I_000307 [Arenicella sp.]|jgi:hypothetical protein